MAMRAKLTDLNTERLYMADEFEQLPQFDERYELIDGRVVEKAVPGVQHSLIALNLVMAFRAFDDNQSESLGLMTHEASVVLGTRNVPLPDLVFWKTEHEPDLQNIKKAGPLPDLVMEVHSPRDLVSPSALTKAMLKVQKLLRAGVPIVWVVYPDRQVVEVYHAHQAYEDGPVRVLDADGVLDGEDVIPGFRLPVADLFKLKPGRKVV